MKPHNALRALRETTGMNQAAYAKSLGVRADYYRRIELGVMPPGAKVLRGIWRVHGELGFERAGVTWWDVLGMVRPRG